MRSANTFHGAKVQAGGMAKDNTPARPILKLRPVPAPEPEAKQTTEPEAKPRKGKAKWRTAARYLAGLAQLVQFEVSFSFFDRPG